MPTFVRPLVSDSATRARSSRSRGRTNVGVRSSETCGPEKTSSSALSVVVALAGIFTLATTTTAHVAGVRREDRPLGQDPICRDGWAPEQRNTSRTDSAASAARSPIATS